MKRETSGVGAGCGSLINIIWLQGKQPEGELALDTHVVVSLSRGQLLSLGAEGRLAHGCF